MENSWVARLTSIGIFGPQFTAVESLLNGQHRIIEELQAKCERREAVIQDRTSAWAKSCSRSEDLALALNQAVDQPEADYAHTPLDGRSALIDKLRMVLNTDSEESK